MFWENHVSAKHLLARTLSFSLVVNRAHHKSSCRQDYHPLVSVIFKCFMHVIGPYKVPKYLMYSFYDCFLLRVPWGSRLSLNYFFLPIFSKFMTEGFSSLVIHNLYWTWILDQPRGFYQVCYFHCFIVAVLCHF